MRNRTCSISLARFYGMPKMKTLLGIERELDCYLNLLCNVLPHQLRNFDFIIFESHDEFRFR